MINLLFIIHILACTWSYIGIALEVEGSWISGHNNKNQNSNKFDAIPATEQQTIYIYSIYWVITTLTTVGYGDIVGATNSEHLFQMGVEFIGIGFFSFLMGSINNILV